MAHHRLSYLACLVLVGFLPACHSLTPSAQPTAGPLFSPTSEDASRLARLAHDLEAKASHCLEAANCEHVYFGRALLSLFVNRETAQASFRHVIEHNQSGPLAGSSRLWLQLIANDHEGATSQETHAGPWTEIVAQYVREWIDRQLTEPGNLHTSARTPTMGPMPQQPADQSRIIQGMEKQLRDRDRQIAVLHSQLEALKVIDQDHAEKQRKVRPPASLRAAEHYPER